MSQFKEFLSRYPLETFDKGQMILLAGDAPRGVYIVESGLVKTYTISASGNECLMSIDGRETQFPLGFASGIIEKSNFYYEAYNRCRVRIVPRDDYNKYLRSDIDSLYARHLRMTIQLMSMFDRIRALEQPRASGKVARTLLYMASRVGSVFGAQSNSTNLKITQQEIANLLGLSRETASAELKNLELKKLIRYSRKNYTIYTQKIEEYVEDQE